MSHHERILNILYDAGHEAYLVGGYVRDTLLHRSSKDIDIATAATPTQVQALFPDSEWVGAHFGVTLVKDGAETVEVATFRLDGAYSDSRHPDSVEFTADVREDVKRRDFTINALAMDLCGEVHDHVGGIRHLRDRLIVTVGDPDARFLEDALRMLRAVRFACQLDFTIEARTFEAIQRNASAIRQISAERIAQELNRILLSGRAAYGVQLLQSSGLLDLILPEISAMIGVRQNALHHPEGDVFTHTMGLLSQLQVGCSLTLALAALLHDVGKPTTAGVKDGQPTFYGHEDVGAEMVGPILSRLKYPSEVIQVVSAHVAEHMRFRVAQEMRPSKLYRFIRQPHFEELLALHRLDATAGSGNLTNAEFVEGVLAQVPPESMHPPRLLTGKDLIDLGLKPGPQFRVLLDALETEQLEGRIADRAQALAFIQSTTSPTYPTERRKP
jgi:poly(A) polymerase